MNDFDVEIIPYNSALLDEQIKSFDCENIRINRFFKEEASELEECGAGNTSIYYDKNSKDILGFVTVSVRSLDISGFMSYPNFQNFVSDFNNSFGIKQFPALEIMRLGVDKKYKNNRVGSSIVIKIMEDLMEIKTKYNLPVNVIFLEALNQVTGFYEKLGFEFAKCSDQDQLLDKYEMLINYNKIFDILST